MKLYSFIYLQKILKKNKLRNSRPYLNTLEQSGVIPKPNNQYVSRLSETFGTKESRAYTQEELDACVAIIKKLTSR